MNKSQIKRALISVTDKKEILTIASFLQENNIEIISTGGTAKYLTENNIKNTLIEDITQFPEILDGRVKTLHPNIHAGILADKNNTQHINTLVEYKINSIDLVIVNLYNFAEVQDSELINNIDIGGLTLLRGAAKNYNSVLALSSPEQYNIFIEKYNTNNINEEYSLELALEVFKLSSQYDNNIYNKLKSKVTKTESSNNINNITLSPVQELRYGENPHQIAKLYKTQELDNIWQGLDSIQQLSGKELSYNNWLDIDASISLISEFEEEIPVCSIVKHNIPCGVAYGETPAEAYSYALDSDPISAFGGIVAFNQIVDKETASLLKEIFLEVIIAPAFSEEALDILRPKKNLRLITTKLMPSSTTAWQARSILGNGMLIQSLNTEIISQDNLKTVTETQVEQEDWTGLLFAYRVAKHVKSNSIVLVNGNRTVGIGGGQTNRINAVYQAIEQASDLATNSILASDGFFPFADSMDVIAQSRIKSIIQPGGSIKDSDVIAAANKYNIPMVFAGLRHFKH